VSTRSSSTGYSSWAGWIGFAGIFMIIVGGIDALQGLIALIRGSYYAVTPNQIIVFDLTGWGVIMILWGIVLIIVGLLVGPGRLFLGLVSGAILAAVVILVLVVLRRITLKTYVPYGPFLIAGAVWALLAPG